MIVPTTTTPRVQEGLLDYLRLRSGLSSLSYVQAPEPVPNGWETYIYRFRLTSDDELPPDLRGPLVLRLYASPAGLPRLTHEFAVQEHMAALNYPVARPRLLEQDSRHLGGPFMVMDEIPGQILVDMLLARPWKIIDGPGRMADLQIWLHRLPARGFPTRPGSLLERSLVDMSELMERHDLPGLRPGLDWLTREQPPEPARPALLHLDFHPLNLLFDGNRCTAVLDWCESDIGDRHADVATTMVLFKSVALEWRGLWQNIARWPGRVVLLYGYLEAYHHYLPLDRHRLRYYFAWASLRRLCQYARWLRAGPLVNGCKHSLAAHIDNDGIDRLRHCFRRWSGITVHV